jgi:hypothetical protein
MTNDVDTAEKEQFDALEIGGHKKTRDEICRCHSITVNTTKRPRAINQMGTKV